MGIESYSEQEHVMVMEVETRYGSFLSNARDATYLLSNIMQWPTKDCDIFIRFLSQMTKYHTLCLMSLVRQHRIQAKMNLRYFLESTAHAAFALVHVGTSIYFDDLANGKKHDAKKASTTAYKWLEREFPEHSNEIKRIKDLINEQTAHANVLNSQHNFKFVSGERPEIHMAYFDFDDDRWTKVDLWECAQCGLLASDLILAVRQRFGGFFSSRQSDRLPSLIAENAELFNVLEEERRAAESR
jgi:hypothetical protein